MTDDAELRREAATKAGYEMRLALQAIAREANREAQSIGASARRGDQGTADTFRWIRDTAERALAGSEKAGGAGT